MAGLLEMLSGRKAKVDNAINQAIGGGVKKPPAMTAKQLADAAEAKMTPAQRQAARRKRIRDAIRKNNGG